MKTPLVWLNVALATVLYLLVTQRDVFIPDAPADLIFIAGSEAGTGAYQEFQTAVESFERDWDRNVVLLGSGGGPRDIALALKDAIERGPRGISLPGNCPPDLLMPLIVDAGRRGITVTFHTAPMPEAEQRFRKRGTGYVGAGSQQDGELGTRFALGNLDFDPGKHVLIAGADPEPVPRTRVFGIKKAVEELGAKPEYIQVPPLWLNADKVAPDPALEARMAREPAPDIVIWDSGEVVQLTSILDSQEVDNADIDVVTFVSVSGLPRAQQLYVKQQIFERRFQTCYMSLVQLQLAQHVAAAGMHIPLNANL